MKIISEIFKLVTFIVLVSSTGACSYVENNKTTTSDKAIYFSGQMTDESLSKGNKLDDGNLYTMGIFVGYENEDESFTSSSPANDYSNNVRYSRSLLTLPFAGDTACFWPFKGKLSFFAYAPYISDDYLKLASDYVSGFPRFSYSPTSDVSEQADFCLANPVLDRTITLDAIPLSFNHTLSRILFSANYSNSLPTSSSKLFVIVDSVSINNIIGSKTVAVCTGNPCFQWESDDTCTDDVRTNYLITRSDNQLVKDSLLKVTVPASDNYRNISEAQGIMYLIPQSLSLGNASLTITYGYYEWVGDVEVLRSRITTSCQLPETTWLPAHTYRYKFTINLAANSIVSLSVSVEDWNNINNNTPSRIE